MMMRACSKDFLLHAFFLSGKSVAEMIMNDITSPIEMLIRKRDCYELEDV